MAKAIEGAVMLGAAVALDIFTAGLATGATALEFSLMMGLYAQGAAAEIGAIADALTSNRGMGITTRQPAAFRQIIYGTQRVAGTIVYVSTTGSHHDQYNMVIVLSGHEVNAIENLYLDGRQVFWTGGGAGWTVRNGVGFGGGGDGQQHIGPNGVYYSFADGRSGHEGVYCAPYFGDQPAGTIDGGLRANDPTWDAKNGQTPYLGGCAYVYLKLEYDTTVFPQFPPEIKFTVQGKQVYDPRTGQNVFSSNPALILADILTDPIYGLDDSTVNQAQLIAAANICDEQVPCAEGTEARYTCNHHYDTSSGIGDVVQTVLNTMGGRLSRISGEWYIFPATYLSPALSFTASDLMGPVQWEPKRAYRELFNRVRGTYTAANYPYNVAGNLYDSNGYYNGQTQNNWAFEWQPDNYPEYACDTLHGYAADEYLADDGGHTLTRELSLPAVLSVSQAQRLAKIELLRNRQQGSGKLTMSLAALQLQPCDTFYITFPQQGWVNKLLEVTSVDLSLQSVDQSQTPRFVVTVGVQEIAPSVYDWSTVEELTPYQVSAIPTQVPFAVAPPTNLVAISNAATALQQPDGSIVPRIEVTWDTPLDTRVTQIQAQYQPLGASTWWDGGTVSVASNTVYIAPVLAGQQYNVQLRSLRANGATSAWESLNGITAELLFGVVVTQSGDGIAPGTLVASAYGDGTASIDADTFTAIFGTTSVTYFPSGPGEITGLAQQTLYYVYVIDPTFTGGDLTPVATTNETDYAGKLGYILLGNIVTPYAAPSSDGGGGSSTSTRYQPSSFSDQGSRTTSNPSSAYDGDLSTSAIVSSTAKQGTGSGSLAENPNDAAPNQSPPSSGTPTLQTEGIGVWSGFSSVVLSSSATLTVTASASIVGTGELDISASWNGGNASLASVTATAAQTTYTLALPTGTNLSTVSVTVDAAAEPTTPNTLNRVTCDVYEIYVQQ